MNTVFETRKDYFKRGFHGAFTAPWTSYREATRYPVTQDEGLSIYLGLMVASAFWSMAVMTAFEFGTALLLPAPTIEFAINWAATLIAVFPAYALMLMAHLRWGFPEISKRLFR